ncbi:MAG: LexA repressor [Alphaproteobacteria bacterium MarineAlpha9_Bin6]|nr:MAG: LexA repressor [Alphaproteobacteria bacterium MarineAlpha9_Bin6]
MLTRKQQQLLLYVNGHLKQNGVAPSFEEMKEYLGLRSKSGVHRLIKALEERGFLRRLHHRARALEVIKLPNESSVTRDQHDLPDGTAKNVVRGDFSIHCADPISGVSGNNSINLPLLGRIAAGTPNEALQDPSRFVDVPSSMINKHDCYALEIAGDSMTDAGILDGDIAIIERVSAAENGEIVVALIDDNEATLKRLRKKGASVALEPANPEYETRIFGPDQVKVQGRLIGLIRNY